jgi:hypothetical protein
METDFKPDFLNPSKTSLTPSPTALQTIAILSGLQVIVGRPQIHAVLKEVDQLCAY